MRFCQNQQCALVTIRIPLSYKLPELWENYYVKLGCISNSTLKIFTKKTKFLSKLPLGAIRLLILLNKPQEFALIWVLNLVNIQISLIDQTLKAIHFMIPFIFHSRKSTTSDWKQTVAWIGLKRDWRNFWMRWKSSISWLWR